MARQDGEDRNPVWRLLPSLIDCTTSGATLVVAGSRGMAGAAGLVGAAALGAGSVLTRVLCPDAIQDTVAGYDLEYDTIGAPCDARGRLTVDALDLIMEEASKATVVAVGPGLGRSEELDDLILRLFFDLEKPAIFAADALDALATAKLFGDGDELPLPRRLKAPRVLTPRLEEFERLFNLKPKDDSDIQFNVALDAAKRTFRYPIIASEGGEGYESCVVALKGERTCVAQVRTRVVICDDEETTDTEPFAKLHVNPSRNVPSVSMNVNLLSDRKGDVLTGIIAGLVAQGLNVMDATRVGTTLHGIAAVLRTSSTISGRGGVAASDLIAFLPYAFDVYEIARQTALNCEDDKFKLKDEIDIVDEDEEDEKDEEDKN